jgi:O-antigen/teichoic acid export membrane protein
MRKIFHSRLSVAAIFILINIAIGAIFFFAIKVFFDDNYKVSQAEDIFWPLFAISLVLPLLILMPYGIGFFYKKLKKGKKEPVSHLAPEEQAIAIA